MDPLGHFLSGATSFNHDEWSVRRTGGLFFSRRPSETNALKNEKLFRRWRGSVLHYERAGSAGSGCSAGHKGLNGMNDSSGGSGARQSQNQHEGNQLEAADEDSQLDWNSRAMMYAEKMKPLVGPH